MNRRAPKSTLGMSEVAAEILIIILVVLIAVVAYAASPVNLTPCSSQKVSMSQELLQFPDPANRWNFVADIADIQANSRRSILPYRTTSGRTAHKSRLKHQPWRVGVISEYQAA